MNTSSFFTASAGVRTCICSTLLPNFYFHSLLPRARVKLHTTIHKHKAARTHILGAFQNTDNSISGQKKRSRRKKNEDSKSDEANSVTHGGNNHMGNISTDTEFILSDSESDVENQDFLKLDDVWNQDSLKLDPQSEENDEESNNKDFSLKWPPLVCCFGSAQSKFTPITTSYRYTDLARARGGCPCNVAIKLARLGSRVAFMGKVGNDASGRQMVIAFNMNHIQTRGLQVDPSSSTSISYMKLNYRLSKVGMRCIKPCAQDSLLSSEINVDILREARIFYFNSMPLLTKSMQSTLLAAIKFSKKCGGDIFFDINLSLPYYKSPTRQIIQQAWKCSNVIKVSKQELDFLLCKDYFRKNRSVKRQKPKEKLLECDPPTREDLSSLWHDDLKVLLVNDGAKLHYYTPLFDGSVPGIEDPCLTRFTYDRAASNDTFIAELMSEMVKEPGIHNKHRRLHTVIRYAITSAIVTQGVPRLSQPYATDGFDKLDLSSFISSRAQDTIH